MSQILNEEEEPNFPIYTVPIVSEPLGACKIFIITQDNPKFFPISKDNLRDFLCSDKDIEPEFLPICEKYQSICNRKCELALDRDFGKKIYTADPNDKFEGRSFDSLFTSIYEIRNVDLPIIQTKSKHYRSINKNDLVVTIDEVKRFEKKFSQKEEDRQPYLDPENELYSVTLDLAIRTWKAVFIEKQYIDKNSPVEAGKAFFHEHKEAFDDLIKNNGYSELSENLIKEIAKIASGEFSPNRAKWNSFREKYKDSTLDG